MCAPKRLYSGIFILLDNGVVVVFVTVVIATSSGTFIRIGHAVSNRATKHSMKIIIDVVYNQNTYPHSYAKPDRITKN